MEHHNNYREVTPEQRAANRFALNVLRRRLFREFLALENHLFPFDGTQKEPAATTIKHIAEALVKKGYLTEEGKPSKLSIEKDYIRENDGSRHYANCDVQPTLLWTGRFLRVFFKEFPTPPFPVSILKNQTPCNTQND